MHTSFLLKLINGALQGKYKDQTKDASLTTDVAKPARLMKGVAMSGPMPRPHTYAHHFITGGQPKCPTAS
jgi:hypothetical protein